MSTEQEIFDYATGKTDTNPIEQTENTTPEPTEAPTEAKEGRVRDDKGRFVPKAHEASEQVAQAPEAQPQEETRSVEAESEAKVPSWRLAEEAQRRRDAEAALSQIREEMRNFQMQMQMQMRQPQVPQQPEEAIDPFADPQGFAQSLQQRFDERLQMMQLENSLRFARTSHGDGFDKAYEAFYDHVNRTRDKVSYDRVMRSGDPGETIVQWYKEQELNRQLNGSDLNSFLEKQREEWLKDPAVQAKVIEAFKATQAGTQPSNTVNIPPSLSKATAVASATPENVDLSDPRNIWAYANKR